MDAQRRVFNCVEYPGDEIIIQVFSFVSNPLPSPPPSKKSEWRLSTNDGVWGKGKENLEDLKQVAKIS